MDEVIGISILIAFLGGTALAIYGWWLTRRGRRARGRKLIAIGVFTIFFAMVGALFEKV
jgi:drug/metabolite transporter superfamily protein YnfA